MARKAKNVDDDFDEEVIDDDEFEEETFTCRICGAEAFIGDGDDMLLLCDKCYDKYDVDKIWEDFDDGKIEEDELTTIDLSKYLIKKGKK